MAKKHKLGETVDKGECIIWAGAKNSGGYPVKWRDGKTRMYSRELWAEHFGPIKKGYCVCHACDNPSCVNIEHLFLATYSDNIKDMLLKNRSNRARGEEHGLSKMTKEDVLKIRALYAGGMKLYEIHRLYKDRCHETCIRKICMRDTWRHLE